MAASLLQQLKALANCGRPWAEQRAQMALLMRSQWSTGVITEEQYHKSLLELTDSNKLALESDNPKVAELLVKAITSIEK